MPARAGRRRLLAVWADDLPMQELVARLVDTGGTVFTVNPDHLWHLHRNDAFLRAYRTADYITVDSHYVRLAMWAIGRPVANRVPGSDVVPALCRRAAGDPSVRIFLLGAAPGVAQRARERINETAGREVVVGAHGPSMRFIEDLAECEEALRMIRECGANVVLVGLGAPKQELWIAAARRRLPEVRVWMGVGATIDYEAGVVRRAPPFLRRVGLEWTYRVVSEPRRYLLRYVRSALFLWWMVLDLFGAYRGPAVVAGRS